jgi:hypothetical protein
MFIPYPVSDPGGHCSDQIAISEASESGILEAYHMKDGYMCFHVPRDDGAALRDIDLLER